MTSPVLTGAPVPRSNRPSRHEVTKDNNDKTYSADKTKAEPKEKSDAITQQIPAEENISHKAAPPQNSQAVLSEGEPANMIESIGSDGKSAMLTIQSGGRSDDSNGAPSNLYEYLKLLNQKVRNNWIPPRGIDRIAVIEFRISKAGRLVSTCAMPSTIASTRLVKLAQRNKLSDFSQPKSKTYMAISST